MLGQASQRDRSGARVEGGAAEAGEQRGQHRPVHTGFDRDHMVGVGRAKLAQPVCGVAFAVRREHQQHARRARPLDPIAQPGQRQRRVLLVVAVGRAGDQGAVKYHAADRDDGDLERPLHQLIDESLDRRPVRGVAVTGVRGQPPDVPGLLRRQQRLADVSEDRGVIRSCRVVSSDEQCGAPWVRHAEVPRVPRRI